MTDRPIIFSASMVQALLAGRKSQTRRLLKGQWQRDLEGHDLVKTWFAPPDVPKQGIPNQWAQSGIWAEKHGEDGYNRHLGFTAYRPGDRLYVRETWSARMTHGWTIADARSGFYQTELLYRADGHESIDGWWSSIHMPREFSRLTLTVTEVRVQRLQDISAADAVAEGALQSWTGSDPESDTRTALNEFEALWNSLHGPGAWATNPWVVAVSFTVQHGNIDAVKANA